MKRPRNHHSEQVSGQISNLLLPPQQPRQRRSMRVNGYDYSPGGAYFVTICAQHRKCLFRQGDYYEHIIRHDEALNRIRQYVLENPARWPTDHANLQAVTLEPEGAWPA